MDKTKDTLTTCKDLHDNNEAKGEKLCRVIWQVVIAVIANLHSYGSFVAITGTIISKLKDEPGDFKMTEDEETWFASLSLFGAILGGFAIGVQLDYLGRRPALMIMQLVSILGLLLLRFAYNVPMLYAGSLLGGYVQGAGNGVMPTYVGEINQPRIRKFTGAFIVLAFTIGFAITKLIVILVSWRTTISIISVLPCVVFILLFFCPETPTWYMLKGKTEIATAVMIRLRGDTSIAINEISSIQTNLDKQKKINSESEQSSYIKNQIQIISKGTFVRPCSVLVIIFAICWQWTGGGPVTFYTEDIMKQFKVPIPASWIATGQGIMQFIFALVGVFSLYHQLFQEESITSRLDFLCF